MSRVLVAVPWRDRGNEWAQKSLDRVVEHLYSVLGEPVFLVDCPQEVWCLAGARNAAMDLGVREGADVVVVCDADTLVEADALQVAVDVAGECGRVVLPFTLFRALSPEATRVVHTGVDPRAVPDSGTLDWSVGGVLVASPEVWDRAGRQDERFTGWGCEDTAFALAAGLLVGAHVRVPGMISHLYHPVTWSMGDPSYKANAELLARYGDASTVDEMRELVAEWRVSA